LGLSQYIKFKSDSVELEKFLTKEGFQKVGNTFTFKGSTMEMTLFKEDYGLFLKTSGDYFKLYGNLISELGTVTEQVIIEDY